VVAYFEALPQHLSW